MNLQKMLEKEHSRRQCDRIVKYIGKDKMRFAEQWGQATPAFRSRARYLINEEHPSKANAS